MGSLACPARSIDSSVHSVGQSEFVCPVRYEAEEAPKDVND